MTEKQQINMFGCTLAEVKAMFEEPLFGTSPAMLVMSILSDCQEVLSRIPDDGTGWTADRLEQVRQFLNKAKFGISEYLSK